MCNLDLELVNATLLTIIIEVPIFYLCGYKKILQILVFVLANYVSNVLLNDTLPPYMPSFVYWAELCFAEILVVAFEFVIMLHFINEDKKKLLRTIFLTNAISVIIGIILLFQF